MNILVLMGGSSAEREISLKTGAGIVAALRRQGHHVLAGDPGTGRLVTGERLALEGGGEKPAAGAEGTRAASSERLPALAEHTHALLRAREASDIEVVFIALHGGPGEDGTMQALLELAGKPYTGSGPLASGLAMDKVMAKRLFVWAGVPTPEWVDLPVAGARALGAAASPVADGPAAPPPALERLGGLPIVVKPVDQGSTIGVSIVQAWSELPGAVEAAAAYGERVLIERYIPGRELAIGILDDRALPVVEIEPTKGVYDYECKYTKGMSRYACPARLEDAVARQVEAAALGAFRVLGCADFGRVDVRLDPGGHPHVLEVNTIPGMTETSLLPMAARALGLSYEALVERMCELALARHRQGGAARSAAPGMSGAGAAVAASRV